MYNIVAQYVIKVKTVPPGKRQSKGWVGFFFFLTFLKAACGRSVYFLLSICHVLTHGCL